jgi:D-aminoacyl-tRNA deacylase
MIAIVVSRADEASERIGEALLDARDWDARDDGERPDAEGGGRYHVLPGFELRTFGELHIHLDDPVPAFDADPDLVVFVSRHSGETGPLLSTHFTGNFGAAEFGGDDRSLARAAPNAGAVLLDALEAHAPEGYEVATECTHHGPTDVSAPSLFAELGSDDPQWRDGEAAAAVARAVLDLEGVPPDRDRQLVGFGGGHYAPRFGRVARETGWAVGHVAADWTLEAMGPPSEAGDVLERAFEASGAEHALFEAERPALRAALEESGYRVVSETWVRETDGVDLDVVDAVESALGSVDDGVRFGARAADSDPDEGYAVVDLPDELVGAATGVDEAAARAAVRDHTVAHGTTEGASRPAGRALVTDANEAAALVDALADVLAEKYDEVERAGGAVVARTVGFDPAKAATLGVPEGPKFGELAAGRAVEVDGERVDPDVVESEREERFPVGLAVRRPSDAEGER